MPPLTPKAFLLRILRWLLVLLCITTPLAPGIHAQESGLKQVTLQLKWTHQFQFAGYYMALANGHYRRAGLDVKIVPGGPNVDVTERVVSGSAHFGVGTSGLLLDYDAGKPVVVLGVIYQHSPLVLIMRADKTTGTLQDLMGKKVMMEQHSAALLAMFRAAGLPRHSVKLIPYAGNAADIFKRGVYAFSAYLTDEPYVLDQLGIKYFMFSPGTYGIDFYGDNFFTSRQLLENDPELVRSFRAATVAGWRDVLRNPQKAVDLILAEYSQAKSRRQLLFEARSTIALMTKLVPPGYMLAGRWRYIAETYVETGMLKSAPDLAGFMFQGDTRPLPKWFWQALGTAIAILIFLILLSLYFRRLNTRLKSEMTSREQSEQKLLASNRELKLALGEIQTLRGILPICSHCKKIRNDQGAWEQIESYIANHSKADFSHGICPDCIKKHYRDILK
jgi:ABC-type nitrate/sulfonate/bicarbonate transport system substrate-binding protein